MRHKRQKSLRQPGSGPRRRPADMPRAVLDAIAGSDCMGCERPFEAGEVILLNGRGPMGLPTMVAICAGCNAVLDEGGERAEHLLSVIGQHIARDLAQALGKGGTSC